MKQIQALYTYLANMLTNYNFNDVSRSVTLARYAVTRPAKRILMNVNDYLNDT